MRVFVLCTGRNGSLSLYHACQHMTNYTCSHESEKSALGEKRFAFPENHIEVDNRLSWFTGTLEKKFGDEAVYVHLKRDKAKTARSFTKRFGFVGSILTAFTEGIKQRRVEELSQQERYQIAVDYIDTVTDNVEFFLQNKTRKMEFHLEHYQEGFKQFWELIGAQGDYDQALSEFSKVHNSHQDRKWSTFSHKIKIVLLRLKNLFSN